MSSNAEMNPYRTYALLFGRRRFAEFNSILLRLGLRGLGIMNYYDFKVSGEKYLIDKILSQYDCRVVFDVGANEGDYSEIFSLRSNCQVFSFEPHPVNFARLKKKFSGDNVYLFQIGLSDKEETVTLFDYKDNPGSQHASIYKHAITDLRNVEAGEIQVEMKTIDGFARTNNISKINLLKIDTEGNEYKVLEGAVNCIKNKMIDIIHFEFNEMNVISRVFFKDFVAILKDYNLYRLLPNDLLPLHYHKPLEHEIFAFQNVVAFRKDIDKNR